MGKSKAAVIGLGNIGFLFNFDSKRTGVWSHAEAYRRSGMIESVIGVDPIPELRTKFSNFYRGVETYSNLDDLFLDQIPDVVSICTPTETHYSIVRKCAEAGVKAIFCEKPIADNIENAKKIVKICRKHRVTLAVNHTRRWDGRYKRVANIVGDGQIGDVKSVSAWYSGQIFNIGTHLIDTIRMIIRKDPIFGVGYSPAPRSKDPHISGFLQFSDDIPCTFNCNGLREDLIFEIDVLGSEGRVRILENGNRTEMYQFRKSSNYSGYRELFPKHLPRKKGGDRFIEAVKNFCRASEDSSIEIACGGVDGFYALASAICLKESALRKGKIKKVASMID